MLLWNITLSIWGTRHKKKRARPKLPYSNTRNIHVHTLWIISHILLYPSLCLTCPFEYNIL